MRDFDSSRATAIAAGSTKPPPDTMSVRLKIMMTFAAACVTIIMFTLAVTRLQLSAVERSSQLEAKNVAQSMAYNAATQPQSLQRYVEGMDTLYRRDLFIVDTHRKTIADIVPSEIGDTYADDPGDEVGRTISDGQVRMFVEISAQHPGGARQIVVPIRKDGRVEGSIAGAVILEYSNIYDELLHASMWELYAVAAAGLFSALLVGIFGVRLGNSISARLTHLQAGVERVASGQYDARLAVDARDEIGALQASFNVMATDLSASRTNLLAKMEEEKASAQKIEHLAYYDNLTGLANRALFSRLLAHELLEARRYNRQLAVMFVDLDRFKNINDTLGHEAGDALLKEVAERLKSTLRASDAVARLGGDEFVILLPNLNAEEQLATVAQKILAAVAQPYLSHDQEFRVTASIGISTYPGNGVDEPTLMKHADIAMYQAKEDGKNTFAFYTDELNKHSIERLAFESSLRHALENRQFEVHYQPKVECRTGRMTGVEALLRWNHPDLGWVPPSKFIPIAEETGLIVALGRWVLETACRQQVAWCKQGLPSFRMAVNLSARQFGDDHLLTDVGSVLESTGIDPEALELEITESMLMHNVRKASEVLTAFKKLGIRLSVDDFGTGYSSLSNLKRFPVDTIKVDRSFVRDLPDDEEDKAIADAIITMGKSLGMTIVAEGVETQAQASFLREHGCDEIQGFFYSKAISATAVVELLKSRPSAVLSGCDVVPTPRGRTAESAFLISL